MISSRVVESATFRVCSWPLLIVIEKITFRGFCKCLNWNRKLVLIMRILGINTASPVAPSVRMVVYTMCCLNFVTSNLVPLNNLSVSRLHICMTSYKTLSSNLCEGIPDRSKEFKPLRDIYIYMTVSIGSLILPGTCNNIFFINFSQ